MYLEKNMVKNGIKGITLIALIITIIVLLILAGITVAQLRGNNLFENAKLAKEKYKQSKEQEDEIIRDYEDAITGDRGSTQYDVIFNYDATDAQKKADAAGTYSLNLGNGKNSVDDYKMLIVYAQSSDSNCEVSNIIYNFSDKRITAVTDLYGNGCQYSNSMYAGESHFYNVRYKFLDKYLCIFDILKKGFSGAKIIKIVAIY